MVSLPPFNLQRRAWDSAWSLRTNHADLMDLAQNVRMEVLIRMEPGRLGWDEVGDAMCLYARLVAVRV